MLITVTSKKSIPDVAAAIHAAAQAHQFGVLHVHDIKETLTKKGLDFNKDCLILEVCQPTQAKKVLDTNASISTALPCRISVYKDQGVTTLATIKPTLLLEMFGTKELAPVAKEVEDEMVKIMEEAAG